MTTRESRLGFAAALGSLAVTAALLSPQRWKDAVTVALVFLFCLAFGKLGEFFDRRSRAAAKAAGKDLGPPRIDAWMVGAGLGIAMSALDLQRHLAGNFLDLAIELSPTTQLAIDFNYLAVVAFGAAAYAAAIFASRWIAALR